jgi:hypothetical protein
MALDCFPLLCNAAFGKDCRINYLYAKSFHTVLHCFHCTGATLRKLYVVKSKISHPLEPVNTSFQGNRLHGFSLHQF